MSPNFGVALNVEGNLTDPIYSYYGFSVYLTDVKMQIYWTGGAVDGYLSV